MYTCIRNRFLYTLNKGKIRPNKANKYIFWDPKIFAIQAKIGFIKYGIVQNHI